MYKKQNKNKVYWWIHYVLLETDTIKNVYKFTNLDHVIQLSDKQKQTENIPIISRGCELLIFIKCFEFKKHKWKAQH